MDFKGEAEEVGRWRGGGIVRGGVIVGGVRGRGA
jgi:hypothetical protein